MSWSYLYVQLLISLAIALGALILTIIEIFPLRALVGIVPILILLAILRISIDKRTVKLPDSGSGRSKKTAVSIKKKLEAEVPSETKKKLNIIFLVLQRNFEKWEGINSGVIEPRRKSDINDIYGEIKLALKQYRDLIMGAKINPSHLDKYEAMKEFTKFPGAAIQPGLFQKAKKALTDAFPKEEKAHNKSIEPDG